MIKMKNVQEKVNLILSTLKYDDQDNTFDYSNRLLLETFKSDVDFDIIKSKMNNLVNKLNSFENEKELYQYLNKDFESEIWNDIVQ